MWFSSECSKNYFITNLIWSIETNFSTRNVADKTSHLLISNYKNIIKQFKGEFKKKVF